MSTNNLHAHDASAANNEIDLVRLLGELLDHRKFILILTALFTLAALLYALFATPVYQADALIQVEQKQGNALLSNLSEFIPDSSPESAPELQLLQSRMILGKTIDDLNLRTQVSENHFPLVGRGWARLTGQQPGIVDIRMLNLPPVAGRAQKLTLTVGENGHYQLEGDNVTLQGVVGQPLSAANIAITIAAIQAKPGTQFTITQLSELEAIDALQLRFSVSERSKDSGMLGLTITGEDPDEMARVLNCIADNYLQQNVARQAAQDAKSLQFLKQQLPQVRSELDQAEEKLNRYRQQNDSVDLNLEAKAVLEQIVNADNQLNELTFREAEISQLYKKDHPTYRALIEKRQTLEQEKNRLNKRVSSMPSTQQEVLRLSRDVESGRVIYQQLLNREQELSIARSSAIGNVRIIDPAVTRPQPVKPKKALVVVLGVLLGLFVSVGWILARSMLRMGIETPEQLEEHGINV